MYLDGAALTMTGRYTQLQDGLYITSVQPDDTGSYVCVAENVAGSVESEGTLSIHGRWLQFQDRLYITSV